ncbi:MAG: hypothetical protein PVJ73_17965 [Acidobacteriota bacterium]|jgi:hypothetical protein
MSTVMSFGKRDTLLGALLCLGILAGNVGFVSARYGLVHKAKQVKETDQWRYIQMSRHPDGGHRLAREATYCWRIFVPRTVNLLVRAGLSENLSFWLITNLFLFGFLLVTWIYLRDLGFTMGYRITGLLLLGLTQGAVRWYEYQYWITDPPALFLIVLALLFIHRGWHAALYPPSILAAFVRESYVAVYPYYFIRLWRTRSFPEAVRRTATLAVVPVIILVALRVLIVPDQPDNLVAEVHEMIAFRLRHIAEQPYLFTVGAWGVLFPLLLLFPARLPGLIRRHPEDAFYTLFFVSLCLVANNTERELGYALPAVLPAALHFLRAFVAESRLPLLPVATAAVFMQVLFYLEQEFGAPGMSIHQPTSLRLSAAMVVFWIVAQALLARGRRPEEPSAEA